MKYPWLFPLVWNHLSQDELKALGRNDPDLPSHYWGFDGRVHPERFSATDWRRYRLRKARRLGTHTREEWIILRDSIGCCVICGKTNTYLEKDHINSIMRGGCDCIHNIQPVCPSCNSRKGARRWPV